jgi:hypothetical protein
VCVCVFVCVRVCVCVCARAALSTFGKGKAFACKCPKPWLLDLAEMPTCIIALSSSMPWMLFPVDGVSLGWFARLRSK